jgi:hypothetical protein
MESKRGPTAALALMAGILFLLSCGTQTTLDTSWHIPLSTTTTFKKLAVIAMLKNPTTSEEFEIAVVGKFQHFGVTAVPGFSLLGGETNLSQDQMENRVEASGADGVLLFKMIAVDTTMNYIPPTSYVTVPPGYATSASTDTLWWKDRAWGYYHPYPHHYWGYWFPAMQVVSTPGYWETESTDRVETALYRTSDNKLVWTAVSSTYDPNGNYDLAASLSGVVLKRLERDGLIQPQ